MNVLPRIQNVGNLKTDHALYSQLSWIGSKFRRLLFLTLGLSFVLYFSWQVKIHRYEQTSGSTAYSLYLLQNAKDTGAVCLDGSLPGYYWKKGWGAGESSWIVFFEGGGWCTDIYGCQLRSHTRLGSSKFWPRITGLQGILSKFPEVNPEFYNWNTVYVKYCDGGSFSGDVEEPVKVKGQTVFFRGERIYRAVVSDLLSNRGLNNSSHILLSGCSAGGLAALLHCQHFSDWMPKTTQVKCLADGGFFLDQPDISGKFTLRALYQNVVNLQNVHLSKKCMKQFSGEDSWKCFFPEYLIAFISAPLFIINSMYDTWQIGHVFAPASSDPLGHWTTCRHFRHPRCSFPQMERLKGYREEMVKAMSPILNSTNGGTFLDSCLIHCQAQWSDRWHNSIGPHLKLSATDEESPRLTMAQAVGNWYFGRQEAKLVDCPHSCNPTCPVL